MIKNKNQAQIVIMSICMILFANPVFCEARFRVGSLTSPPRDPNPASPEIGPCAGAVRSNNITTLMAGSMVTLEWEETVDRPGSFRIAFSANGDLAFEENILVPMLIDEQNDGVLPNTYTMEITVPNVRCSSCALQLIQTATDVSPAQRFYSCTDIQIIYAPPAPPTNLQLQFLPKSNRGAQ